MRRFSSVACLLLGLILACADTTAPTAAPQFILEDPGETTQPPTHNPCRPGFVIWWVYETTPQGVQLPPWWFCASPAWW